MKSPSLEKIKFAFYIYANSIEFKQMV